MSMGGPISIDLNILPFLLKTLKIPKKEHFQILHNLGFIESGALQELNKISKEKQKKRK